MSGYRNRFILLEFPEVGDDASILLRNPRLVPPDLLEPEAVAVDANGEPLDREAARQSMHKVLAGLIVAWRGMYDATIVDLPADLPADGDLAALMARLEESGQQPLGAPSPETVARLPIGVVNRLAEEIGNAANPQ
ncbi:hypothetical protein [Kitasatospora cathayae]|uniref:Ku domain-containing protein n=1 Tax=Kitasatospora cathayae TaxID=3004092 RepID=A0ABY7QAT0_9ACTN|nr:hypothetical protein [Kitasatospora sp. HUAS 3-15]WBP89539.1 hypothetical protein O1G21_29320 [Kitasatospora sp. HUAS 3-15]